MFQQTIFVIATETVETVLKMESITRTSFASEESFYREFLKLSEDEESVFYQASLYAHCLNDRLNACVRYGMYELYATIWTENASFIVTHPSTSEMHPSPLWWVSDDEEQTEQAGLIMGFGELVNSETVQEGDDEEYAEFTAPVGGIEEEVDGRVMSVAKRRRV